MITLIPSNKKKKFHDCWFCRVYLYIYNLYIITNILLREREILLRERENLNFNLLGFNHDMIDMAAVKWRRDGFSCWASIFTTFSSLDKHYRHNNYNDHNYNSTRHAANNNPLKVIVLDFLRLCKTTDFRIHRILWSTPMRFDLYREEFRFFKSDY